MKLRVNSKLSLNKKTITNLNNGQMNEIKGGTARTEASDCPCTNTWWMTCDQNSCIPAACIAVQVSNDCVKTR